MLVRAELTFAPFVFRGSVDVVVVLGRSEAVFAVCPELPRAELIPDWLTLTATAADATFLMLPSALEEIDTSWVPEVVESTVVTDCCPD